MAEQTCKAVYCDSWKLKSVYGHINPEHGCSRLNNNLIAGWFRPIGICQLCKKWNALQSSCHCAIRSVAMRLYDITVVNCYVYHAVQVLAWLGKRLIQSLSKFKLRLLIDSLSKFTKLAQIEFSKVCPQLYLISVIFCSLFEVCSSVSVDSPGCCLAAIRTYD